MRTTTDENNLKLSAAGELKLKVEGLDCADCALALEKEIASRPEVASARVDFVGRTLSVSGQELKPDDIAKAVQRLGYKARPAEIGKPQATILRIPDMDCADEERLARDALKPFKGVRNIRVNLIKRELTVEHSEPLEDLVLAIRKAGLKAIPKSSAIQGLDNFVPRWKLVSVLLATAIVGIGVILMESAVSPAIYRPVFLIGMIIGGWQIAYKGFLSAKRLRLDMNFLMTSAVIGAAVIGQWSEAGAVIVLFAIAQLLETFSLGRSRRAISSLLDLSPRFATLVKGDGFHKVPVGEVKQGDIVLVRPGERVPIDGDVRSGRSSVDQAAITGESRPVEKASGDQVFAGTINAEGALEIVTTHAPGDTTLDRIIKMVEEAHAQRAPSQTFVDKFSAYYTPAVVGLALLLAVFPPLIMGGSWTEWIYRALALLVIACPCALVISTPITIVSALANSARNGVLIKGGVFLENAYKIKTFALDKTGTLTRGRPAVNAIVPQNGHNPDEILRLAASIETHSGHPIARAIVRHARKSGLTLVTPQNFQEIPGRGAAGLLDGQNYFLGNRTLFEEKGLVTDTLLAALRDLENASQSTILLGTDSEIHGLIAIADEVRPETSRFVEALRREGVSHVALLTGDNQLTADAVGKLAGVDAVHAELHPRDKVEIVKQLRAKYGDIAMVGDGVNDAPALAAAGVGIAMGAAGSDSALETADIALMADELEKIPWVMRLSRKAHGIIVANIALAILIKFAFILLAALGMATLWMAVFADMGVSLMVIFNGMRALHSR